jgi:hypothetical protein
MNKPKIGDWVEITIAEERTWVGQIVEWDEDAIMIGNGIKEGQEGFKAAECTNVEATAVILTDKREFSVN